MIEEVAAKLQEETIATLNADMFIDELPINKQDCIAVMHSPSPVPHKTFENHEQHIDFWARYTDSKTAYDKLLAIQAVFHREKAYDMDNYHVYFSNSLGAIDDMGRDSERRKMYKLTIRFIYRPIE